VFRRKDSPSGKSPVAQASPGPRNCEALTNWLLPSATVRELPQHLLILEYSKSSRFALAFAAQQDGKSDPTRLAFLIDRRQPRGGLCTIEALLEVRSMSSRPSFNKRQKEQARKEKQRLKAERKQQRKLERDAGQSDTTAELQTSVPREGQGS